jgi:hypothetical protein
MESIKADDIYQMPGNKLVVQSALKTQDREWEIQSINTEEFLSILE